MSTATIQTVNLLPTYFQTNKNSKFLSSTIDQLIQPAQLERLNAYIGSTSTPTYSTSDNYIVESSALRQAYQLEPALVTSDIVGNINTVVAIDDLANEISIQGGYADNFDRLFRSEVYSYYPQIDWDKLVNYENYYWLPTGSFLIDIDQNNLDVANVVVGQSTATVTVNGTDVTLLNGMLVTFSGQGISSDYLYKEFFVEGTGTSIVLVPYDSLITPEAVAIQDSGQFDLQKFDSFGFDNDINLPLTPEYVTINRASLDRNPWSRYNRWISAEVITVSSLLNKNDIELPTSNRAHRPIIEFNANIQLYNFGSTALKPVDIIDTTTTDAFSSISGYTVTNYTSISTLTIDGINLEYGQRIIFTADPNIRNNIYKIDFLSVGSQVAIALILDESPTLSDSITVKKGTTYGGTSWWFDGTNWVYAQQHTTLNSGPLFDLFDDQGNSYSNKEYYLSNFVGNKLFGYQIGSGLTDPVLGVPLNYRNINAVGSFLFENYFNTGVINISTNNLQTIQIKSNNTYFKINSEYVNVWNNTISPQIQIGSNGYYDVPLGLTNNPLNSNLTTFTLADLDEQAASKTRLISNANPMSFAMMFIGKKENNVIDAIEKSAAAYNYFKLALINQASLIENVLNPANALDEILSVINTSKSKLSPYYLSDMLGYGIDKSTITYIVTNNRVTSYSLSSEFSLSTVNARSVLVYVNDQQLTHGIDYEFDTVNKSVVFLNQLSIGDVITINDYASTEGCFIPTTPTKLGLYPSYVPKIYSDNTYANGPVNVIQGHDGSLMVAYNDYRDDIILEFELRVYNNLKIQYRAELFDINSSNPGAFRNIGYSQTEITGVLEQDLISWAGAYGVDYLTNTTFVQDNPFTWNYANSYNSQFGKPLSGNWRSIFKYFYDTDRPHTNPWEMLGFTVQPDWWTEVYGPAPYTSGNGLLWEDLESGRIAQGVKAGVDSFYARPGLSTIIPVDIFGDLLDPISIGLVNTPLISTASHNWIIGDQGPAETAWRRSSFWPFVVQRLLALTKPATYCSLMYDPFNMQVNVSGQWTYGNEQNFLALSSMPIHGENGVPTSGYSVLVSEIGQQRTQNYIANLRQDLEYGNFNLFHKVGGFVNQNTLQIIIDAYNPTSTDPGAILPNESYSLILNSSNPIRSIGISGMIIQRSNGNYVVKGYDQSYPYFTYYPSVRNSASSLITIGGVSSPYVTWSSPTSIGANGLSTAAVTTAKAATGNIFYQAGQIVQYGNNFYKVLVSHSAESTFDTSLYQILPALPTVGGATVQLASKFDKTPTPVAYGTTLSSIQEVYDLIVGYGEWLTDQGFIFDAYNKDLQTTVDWHLSAREFLYWSTQNWIDNSIITISPFSDQLTYQYNDSVVDNVFDSFYNYSIAKSDGTPFPQANLFITRQSGVFTINTINTVDGIYFARLNSIQKEHGMVFDNTSIFGDIIYNIETGERQQRMKLVGFRTANWNGDFFSPGFVYDEAIVKMWQPYTDYLASDVVKYNGSYYSAISNLYGAESFNFTQWNKLGSKPVAGLLPNFDYKISQFNDFYSLDIDNFDSGIQQAAQNLIGYIPRPYLNNIFTDPVAQYKFYQGYIREKGTLNAIAKLAKASIQNLNSKVEYGEEWAFRVGQYGSFTTYQEFEVPLTEGNFLENPQIISFVDSAPTKTNNFINYFVAKDLTITDTGTIPIIATTSTAETAFKLIHSGYVQLDDVDATAYNQASLLDIGNNDTIKEGTTIWLGFTPDGDWNVYRYELLSNDITNVELDNVVNQIIFTTAVDHKLTVGNLISIVDVDPTLDGIYFIQSIPASGQFTVNNTFGYNAVNTPTLPGFLFEFKSVRFDVFDNIPSDKKLYQYPIGTTLWIDSGNGTDNNGWAVYKKIINYNSKYIPAIVRVDISTGLGYSIHRPKGSNFVATGGPTYASSDESGQITVYQISNGNLLPLLSYHLPGTNTQFGYKVIYDDISFNSSTYGLVFAGAPGYLNSGSVVISSIDGLLDNSNELIINNPNPSITGFGSSIFVQRNTSTKTVLVGAPTGHGAVYSYTVVSTQTVTTSSLTTINPGITLTSNARWGSCIVGSDDAKYIAISAPGQTGTGFVSVYQNKTLLQNITTVTEYTSLFGQAMAMSPDGSYLVIGAPGMVNDDLSLGFVSIYTLTNGLYTLDQTLYNPISGQAMNFGSAIDINTACNQIIISSLGTDTSIITTFEEGETYFDLGATNFVEIEENSGTAYLYSRRDYRFVFSEEITTSTVYNINGIATSGTNYGQAVSIDNDFILVGKPSISSSGTAGVYQFTPIDPTINGWDQIRIQDSVVIPEAVQKISFINTVTDKILNYYDYVDPLKNKILGIAEKELSYRSPSDPAIYSIGNTGTNINTTVSWLDDHIGELWWDLSTAKYVWYEQGDLEYRKTNWGKLFPGASIDVYEWVGSNFLPSDWAIQADTTIGLTSGISGQPKYPDNSTVSVKQVYDPITGSFSNMYYYWVKNKVTIPNVPNRKISSYLVANYISDPDSAGVQYAAFISSSSLILSNLGTELIDNQISLNFAIDNTESEIPRHTEWALLQEGSDSDVLPALLEKKMIDSLLGHDSVGNLVPDPSLSVRTKFGIGIRPQQTLFNNRYQALRNVVEFANSILINIPVTGNYSFENLNAAEPYPTGYPTVEDNSELTLVIVGNTSTSKVVVLSDDTYNGGWTLVNFINDEWVRVRTQAYNTPSYWKYVDWVSTDYDKFKPLTTVVNDVYQLNELTLSTGQYAKVNNRGDGNYLIVEKVASGSIGNFSNNFNFVYIQNGTIQLLDTLWNLSYGWDEFYSYNQTLFDQSPDLEISYILDALKKDLFINDLKVNWNLLFFKAVRYAFTEQTSIDWAFKTSFINVTNYAGTLTQTPVYKLQDSAYYEDYINEVKPYHTQIRKFTANFTNTEITNTSLSDFDYPAYWNTSTKQFVTAVVSATDVMSHPVRSVSGTIVFDRVSITYQKSVELINDTFLSDDITSEFQLSWLAQADKSKITVSLNSATILPTDYTVVDNSAFYSTLKFLNYAPTTGTVSITYQKNAELINDTFLSDDITSEFQLSWLAQADKSKITVSLNSATILPTDYTVVYNSAFYQTYNKQYSTLKFLNYAPTTGTVSIKYHKSVELMTAAERIAKYYKPVSGMPGNDLGQLMVGAVDPRKQIGGQFEGRGFTNRVVPDSYINTNNVGLTNVIGINPADITIDGGYNFIPTYGGTAPEELVPGYTADTLGINVYTQTGSKQPLIFNGRVSVASTTTNQSFHLKMLPPSINNISVSMNGNEFTYITTSSFNLPTEFTIDWANSELIIAPQATSGLLGYVIIGLGDSPTSGAGIVGSAVLSVSQVTHTQVIGNALYSEVSSVYVTVDGVQISPVDTGSNTYYTISTVSGRDQRVAVNVFNFDETEHTIQVWFFNSIPANYVSINEETIDVTPTALLFSAGSDGYLQGLPLTYPPEYVGPPSSQIIIEATIGGITQQLRPPSVVYYTVTSTSTVNYLAIDTNSTLTNTTINDVNVYHNGNLLSIGSDLDYTYSSNTVSLTTSTLNSLVTGDIIAVESFVANNITKGLPSSDPYSYDYIVNPDGVLFLAPPYCNYTRVDLRIISFADQDSLAPKVQIFQGNPSRMYILKQKILNPNYIWVTINVPNSGLLKLVNEVDFELLSDHMTVLINDKFNITSADTVIVTYFEDPSINSEILGYRITNDFLGGTSYTRISDQHSTYLTQPLHCADTEIYVADASVLSEPNVTANAPGVIMIAGEIIEFFNNKNNVLSNLRRATRGTSSASYLENGTRVIDQGVNQIIPMPIFEQYADTILIQNTFTSVNLNNTYIISKETINGLTTPLVTDDTVSPGETPNTLINHIIAGLQTSSTSTASTNNVVLTPTAVPVRCDGIKLLHNVVYNILSTSTATSNVLLLPSLSGISVGDTVFIPGDYGVKIPVGTVVTNIDTGRTRVILNNKITKQLDNGTAVTFNNLAPLPTDPYTGEIVNSLRVYPVSTASIDACNLVQVYYGGYLLRKDPTYYLDTTISYDGISTDQIVGSVPTVSALSTASFYLGNAYICEDTGKVWVCTQNQFGLSGVPHYVDSGLRRINPDFTIVTATQQLILNTATVSLQTGTLLSIVMRQSGPSWNDTIQGSVTMTDSILTSTSTMATFLQASQAVLPN